jgi:hypothetical protein
MQILDTDYQSYLMVYHCQEYQKMVSDKHEEKTQEEIHSEYFLRKHLADETI